MRESWKTLMRVGASAGTRAVARVGTSAGASVVAIGVAALGTPAQAQTETLAKPWALNFPEPATSIMERIIGFHNWLLVLCALVVGLVTVLIVICVFRFNAKANPTPSRVSHNSRLETIWTLVPALILIVVAFPSYSLLRDQLTLPEGNALIIKATGSQWYWSYTYPDHEGIEFDSVMLEKDELKPNQPYLFAVDNVVVVPMGRDVRIQVAATDVMHAWTIPAFGVKIDAIPGRLNETWFRAEREGVFYGQCSELCGSRHAFMPIEVHVVSPRAFTQWLRDAQRQFSDAPRADPRLASR